MVICSNCDKQFRLFESARLGREKKKVLLVGNYFSVWFQLNDISTKY